MGDEGSGKQRPGSILDTGMCARRELFGSHLLEQLTVAGQVVTRDEIGKGVEDRRQLAGGGAGVQRAMEV